jgi:hypothetical protein
MTDIEHELRRFTGSEVFYRHPLFPKYVYTEGVQYLAEAAGAYWLVEYILSHQTDAKIGTERFQVWTLEVGEDHSAVIRVEDGDKNPVKQFRLTFTDFPMKEFSLWFTGETRKAPFPR